MSAAITVHACPGRLVEADVLTDGPVGTGARRFEVARGTTVLWVDLRPGTAFPHPTAYVLMSAAGTRVEPGGWWPVVNGCRVRCDDPAPVRLSDAIRVEVLAATGVEPDAVCRAEPESEPVRP